jgi:hypothetical protein
MMRGTLSSGTGYAARACPNAELQIRRFRNFSTLTKGRKTTSGAILLPTAQKTCLDEEMHKMDARYICVPRRRGAAELDHLDDRLLADIGYGPDGLPLDTDRPRLRRIPTGPNAQDKVRAFMARLASAVGAKRAVS